MQICRLNTVSRIEKHFEKNNVEKKAKELHHVFILVKYINKYLQTPISP